MGNIYALSKSIKSTHVNFDKIEKPANVSKILDVVSKLEQLPKVGNARVSELKMDSNPVTWIESLLKSYPKRLRKSDFEYLLSTFTDKFKTRMREDTKYVIGLLTEAGLILCHSIYGEETISTDWNTIPRMLDTGNVMRFARFYYIRGILEVKYWEKTGSLSFMEWLGLSRSQMGAFGGEFSVVTEIDGLNARFELSENDMKQLVKDHPEFQRGEIQLRSDVHLVQVKGVRVGAKIYEKISEFMQWYEADNLGIPLYKKKYDALKTNESPLWFRYVDTKAGLMRHEGEQIVTVISKDLPGIDVLFCNDSIYLDDDYSEDFARRIANNETVRVHHVGLPFSSPGLVIGNTRIYNLLNTSAAIEQVVNYFNSTRLQDSALSMCLKLVIFSALAEANKDRPIAHFFSKVAPRVTRTMKMDGIMTELEGKIVEYKSRDVWTGSTDKIASALTEDLRVKMNDSIFKAYFIGIEDDGRIVPISASRLKSDRIAAVKSEIESKLAARVYLLPIMSDSCGILLLSTYRVAA